MLSLATETKYYCSECISRIYPLFLKISFYVESLVVPKKWLPNAQEARRAMEDEFVLRRSYSEVGELGELLALQAAVVN